MGVGKGRVSLGAHKGHPYAETDLGIAVIWGCLGFFEGIV